MKNLSKQNFIPRKDKTRRARIAAEKAERARAIGVEDLELATGGSQQVDKPKYCCGYTPARSR